MTYLISFDISFASDYTSDSVYTTIFLMLTVGKGKNTRSVTDMLICPWSRGHPLQKNSEGFWITNLGAGSILSLLAK